MLKMNSFIVLFFNQSFLNSSQGITTTGWETQGVVSSSYAWKGIDIVIFYKGGKTKAGGGSRI